MRRRYTILIGVILVGLTGCVGQPPSETAAGKFADAVDVTATSYERSLQITQDADLAARDEAFSAKILEQGRGAAINGLETDAMLPSPEAIRARVLVFDGVQAYAQKLAAVSSGRQIEAADKALGELGEALQTFDAAAAKIGVLPQDGDAASAREMATNVIRAFGRKLVEMKRDRELPGMVQDAHGLLIQVVDMVTTDLGEPDRVTGGLREILNLSRKNIRDARALSISRIYDDPATQPYTVYEMSMQARADLRKLDHLESAFDHTETVLNRMLEVHEKLANPEEPSTLAQLALFIEEVKSLQSSIESITADRAL